VWIVGSFVCVCVEGGDGVGLRGGGCICCGVCACRG